jgi:hypothetical protein
MPAARHAVQLQFVNYKSHPKLLGSPGNKQMMAPEDVPTSALQLQCAVVWYAVRFLLLCRRIPAGWP